MYVNVCFMLIIQLFLYLVTEALHFNLDECTSDQIFSGVEVNFA